MTVEHNNITGLVLAGGQSKRFGPTDKAFVDILGKPMIQHVCDQMRLQVSKLLISANLNIEIYKQLGYKVIPDRHPDFQGPLSGIVSVMENISGLLVTVPCDAPIIPEQLVNNLLNKMIEKDVDVVVVYDGQQLQPLYGLYNCRLYHDISRYLENGGRSVKIWLSRHRFATVDYIRDDFFCWNINTQDDLKCFKQQIDK